MYLTYGSYLTNCFNWDVRSESLNPTSNVNAERYFNHFFNIFLNKDVVEIPCIASDHIKNCVNIMHREDTDKEYEVVIPMFYTNEVFVKNFSTLVKTSMNTYFNSRLTKMITAKGEVFYGGYGIILDANYNILMLLSQEYQWRKISENLGPRYYKTKAILYIGKQVFMNQSSFVAKNIIKEVIPYFMDTDVEIRKVPNSKYGKVEIRITDIKMETSETPQKLVELQEDLNNVVRQNLDEIL